MQTPERGPRIQLTFNSTVKAIQRRGESLSINGAGTITYSWTENELHT